MSCIEEDVALALVQGHEVPASVKEHLVGCEACRGFVAGLARVMVPDATASLGGWGLVEGQLEPGTRLGDYEVESVLGRGGMGVVYAGRDTRLDRAVAIKLLRDEVGTRRVAWLRREAAAMAKLSHPNVAAVFDFGECEQGPFVVMELVRGETLGRWTATSRSPESIVEVYAQAGQGLAAAHAAGIVHRDFKPSNAMVVTEGDVGRVKVLDFGLAGALEGGSISDPDVRSASTLGGLGGTPRYAAPEQFLGQPTTPKSDQFSFCVAMFEALAGALPFPGETGSERRTAMLAGQLRPLPGDVPDAVARALRRGLSLEPRRRFASMRALLGALERRPSWGTRLGALGGLTVLVAWLAWPQPEAACDDGVERMGQAWRSDGEWTERADLRRQGEKLDAEVEQWLDARKQLCALRSTDPGRFEAGASCLELVATRIESVGERLRGIDARDAQLPSNLFGDLDDPHACLDAQVAAPIDQILRDELEAFRAASSRLDDDGIVTPDERAQAEAEGMRLRLRAQELGDVYTQAHTVRSLAVVAMLSSRYEDAERLFEEAYFLAELAGDAALRLRIAHNLVVLLATFLEETERVGFWAEQATAVADSIGTDHALGVAALCRARTAKVADLDEPALREYDLAEPLLRREEEHRQVLHERAQVLLGLQQWGDARADLEAAVREYEAELGLGHPELALPLNSLATLEIMEENFEEGAALLERVVALVPRSDRVRRAMVRGNLAILEQRLGRLEDALATFEAISAEFAELLGPEHNATVRSLLSVAEVEVELGRNEEARAELDRLIERGLQDAFLSRALLLRASVVDDPRADLERVLTIPGIPATTEKIARDALAELDSAG